MLIAGNHKLSLVADCDRLNRCQSGRTARLTESRKLHSTCRTIPRNSGLNPADTRELTHVKIYSYLRTRINPTWPLGITWADVDGSDSNLGCNGGFAYLISLNENETRALCFFSVKVCAWNFQLRRAISQALLHESYRKLKYRWDPGDIHPSKLHVGSYQKEAQIKIKLSSRL